MDFKDVEACLALSDELHFGRAAARLHMTQPPFSQRIARLETELGVQLFRRTTRGVSLTPAGVVFVNEIRQVQCGMSKASALARQVGAGEVGLVRVGFVGPAMDGSLPLAFRRCRELNPGIALVLEELTTAAQLEKLQEKTLDAGFIRVHERIPPGLSTRLVLEDVYELAVPDGHELCNRGRISLRDLHGESWIMYPRRNLPTLHDAVRSALERADAPMKIVQEAASKRTTLALVAAGLGIALMPSVMARQSRPGVRLLPLEGDLPKVEIHLAWRADNECPALARFLRLFEPGQHHLNERRNEPAG